MAKGKAKLDSEGVAAPQPRSLRSRKRECPPEEPSLPVDTEAPVHQQDSEANNTAVVSTQILSLESLVKECATTNQTPQAAEQPCLANNDISTEAEKTMKASKELEENCSSNDSHLQVCVINPANGGKEINPQDVTRMASDPCIDHHQGLSTEDGDGSCADALEKQLGISQEEPRLCMDDFKDAAKESALGLPVRKKRRMGMCGLTERERSHFLQTQKHEVGHNGVERVEKQLCNNMADLVAQEDVTTPAPLLPSLPSIPVDSATVQGKAETKPQASHCGGDTRAETEVATSDGTGALWHSGCSHGKTSEAAESTVTGPGRTDEPESNQPAEKTVNGLLVSLKQREPEETVGEISAKQREGGDDDSAWLDCVPFTIVSNKTPQDEGTEKNKDGSEADALHLCLTEARDEAMGNDGVGASTDSGGFSGGCVQLCDTAETPSHPQKKDNCSPDVELTAGSSTANTEHSEIGDTAESFGSQYFDYVSDSQLNSIAQNEEKRMKKEQDPGSSYCPEDATNLICGLIGELSSLNRKVMATHRELDSLRRGSRSSRSYTN